MGTILQERESHSLPPPTVRLDQKSSSVYPPPIKKPSSRIPMFWPVHSTQCLLAGHIKPEKFELDNQSINHLFQLEHYTYSCKILFEAIVVFNCRIVLTEDVIFCTSDGLS